jgi:phosphatidylglycerophosphate synthase
MPIHADRKDPWDQRLARIATKSLARTSVVPNQVTTVRLLLGILCALLYGMGGRAADLGAICFMLAFWLDHVDGDLARMTCRTSRFGHYYDLAVDSILLVGLFVGIGYGLPEGSLGGYAIMLGLAAGLAIAIIFTLQMELEERGGKAAVAQNNAMGFETEDVMYLVGPITWLGGLQPFLVLTAVGAPIYVAYTLWYGRHLLRPESPAP